MNPPPNQKDHSEIDELLRSAVRCTLDFPDFKVALNSFREILPEVAPSLVAQMPPSEEAQRALAFAMFHEVWNRAPRPDHDWRPRPEPKPKANDVCPCGSGHKYKQCCGPLSDAVPFGGERLSLLSYVLERVPISQYKNLPFNKLSPEELGHVASQWREDDRHEEVAVLLEPLLAHPAKLDARHEHAFDMLCDVYLDLGQPDKRIQLVESVMQSPDRKLKSAAMQRRCTMLADQGEYLAAWELFNEAQRIDPDNPSFAHLEVILLINQGDVAEAQKRARFWAVRLKKLGFGGKELVNLMEEIARDPSQFIEEMNLGANIDEPIEEGLDEQSLLQLIRMVQALPKSASHYRLQPQAGDAGPLEADAQLALLEAEWREVYLPEFDPDDNDAYPSIDTACLDWLAEHPLAWHSFVILEDLLLYTDYALYDDEALEDKIDAMEEALFARAVALLRINLSENAADACKLDWNWIENRPALRLVGQFVDFAEGTDEELPLLEWLVQTLDPDDGRGLRERLVQIYVADGRAADALAVCERYPNDALSAMKYARALALYLLERRSEAAVALTEAVKHAPHITKMLMSKKPRMPKLQPGPVTLGGEDEAWYYRQSWGRIWENTGALDWLKNIDSLREK